MRDKRGTEARSKNIGADDEKLRRVYGSAVSNETLPPANVAISLARMKRMIVSCLTSNPINHYFSTQIHTHAREHTHKHTNINTKIHMHINPH